jgi:hypothetical protein
LFFCLPFVVNSRTEVTARVCDKQTKEALAFCSIAIKGTTKGTITNSDGFFSLAVKTPEDMLVISFLGYTPLSLRAAAIANGQDIYLTRNPFVLTEINIMADANYLYGLVEKCRRKVKKHGNQLTSKVYYSMETASTSLSVSYPNNGTRYTKSDSLKKTIPVELLECFYNGVLDGVVIKDLLYKNGRTALANDENYFLTLNSSKAISTINITENSSYFPLIPLQLTGNRLKKWFRLEMYQQDSNLYQISFTPLEPGGFSGTMWIDRQSYDLMAIDLTSDAAAAHPFLPLFPGDSISNVSMRIKAEYNKVNGQMLPGHINFNYSMKYFSRRDTGLISKYNKHTIREISSFGIMYFFDYGKPYILPYFEYNDSLHDYYKMTFVPYNHTFWKNNSIVKLTENQIRNYNYIADSGVLINFPFGVDESGLADRCTSESNILTFADFKTLSHLFEFYHTFWSADKRIVPNLKSQLFKEYSLEKISRSIRSDLYNIKVQILLDVTEKGDSLVCTSYTVFDNAQTFYHLPVNTNTNAFLNIYFDLYEIERRKMQASFDANNFNASTIDSVYKATTGKMKKIIADYLNEVNLGENEEKLMKWNAIVLAQLGIDNIAMIRNSSNNK